MNTVLSRRKEVGDALVREAVTDAAVQVLRDQGLESLTMDAVSEAVGVAKGTLYNYFKNKDELLEAAHDRLFLPLKAKLDEIFSQQGVPALQVVERVVHTVLGYVERDRSTIFILQECASLKQTRARHEQEFVRDIAGILQQGMDQGELRRQDSHACAWFILGLLTFSCRGPRERPESCPPMDCLPEFLTTFLVNSLAKADSTSPKEER